MRAEALQGARAAIDFTLASISVLSSRWISRRDFALGVGRPHAHVTMLRFTALLATLLLATLQPASAQTEHTMPGGPCAALAELETTYIKEGQTQVFNIVDPGSSEQCTWSPSDKRICKGVGGNCEKEEL